MKTRILHTIVFAASLGLSSASAEIIAPTSWWRQFAWKEVGATNYVDSSLFQRLNTNNPSSFPFTALSDTRDGITLSSSPFTDSGFTLTSSATNPTANIQWAQYIYTEFTVNVPTAYTLSGTLYSPNPQGGSGMGGQYVDFIAYNGPPSGTFILSLRGTNNNVVGPQTYFASGILQPNIVYAIDSISTWTTPTDGFNGNFMTLSLSEPIPEPGTWAAAALLVGGAAFMRWRRRKS